MIDYDNIERWITVNGNHIPVIRGQSEEEAFQNWLSNKEISDTADTDDIDIDIELEDEDVKMPYEKKYYYEDMAGYKFLIDEDKLDEYYKKGYQIYELDINDEMNQKMKDLINKYAETNNLREMVSQYEQYLKYNTTGYSVSERRLLISDFRKQAINVCKEEAQKFLNKLPKNENTNIDNCCIDTNSVGYEESRKAVYNSKEYNYYTSNCQRCIIAYEMRRRGYNVEANKYKGRTDEIYNTHLSLSRAFLDYDWSINTKLYNTQPNGEKYSSRGALIKAMAKDMVNEGEGARFVLSWDWKNSSFGHTVNAEIVNGEVKIIDAQVNKQHTIQDLINRKDLRATTLKCTRIDKLNLSNRLEDLIKWNH